MKTKIESGCLPTSPPHEGLFEIQVDANSATIAIDGSYKPVREQRIATADCMGSRTIEQEVDAAGPRRYSVVVNGTYRGVIDASDTTHGMRAVNACFEGRSKHAIAQTAQAETYQREQFKDWIALRDGEATDPLYRDTYETIGDAVAALLGPNPETQEGRPTADVSISRGQWLGRRFQKPPMVHFMAVRIEQHGYPDDSVSGKRTFADVRYSQKTGRWRILGHWYQYMCARGERAGQWSALPCT